MALEGVQCGFPGVRLRNTCVNNRSYDHDQLRVIHVGFLSGVHCIRQLVEFVPKVVSD